MDLHNQMILDDFIANKGTFEKMQEIVLGKIKDLLAENNMLVTSVEGRVKDPKSLAGKLELKGQKYSSIEDITDLFGARVVAFYKNQVDKVASLIENNFEIDWENSVDKRKALESDQFGYMSLHYICRIPKTLYYDENEPNINKYRFEIQLRTALQHVWATANHDTGYKSDIEIPTEYVRSLNRLAGLLEIADEEFSSLLSNITEYRRNVSSLVKGGHYDDLPLNGDTFNSYLEIEPFKALNQRIASINNAEIQKQSLHPYFEVFKSFEFKTIGDIERMKKKYEDDAFRLASLQLGSTDIDIIAETIGVQNLCEVIIIRESGSEAYLKYFLDILHGENDRNIKTARRIFAQAESINIVPLGEWAK